jgi:outer membrane protein assembly factor BamB
LTRGAGCGKSASPDLWEPGRGNPPGDPAGLVKGYDKERKETVRFTPAAHAGGATWWANVAPLPGGKYLVSLGGAGKVLETDRTGKILWEANVQWASSAMRLKNGRTLVASSNGRFVVELDSSGKEVWRVECKVRPFTARRY